MKFIFRTIIVVLLSYFSFEYIYSFFRKFDTDHSVLLNNNSTSFLIIDFEKFQGAHLEETIQHICQTSLPNVIVYSDDIIYPPLDFKKFQSNCQVHLIEESKSFSSNTYHNIFHVLNYEYLFIVPSDVEFKQRDFSVQELISTLINLKFDALVLPFFDNDNFKKCKFFKFDIKRWTLYQSDSNNKTLGCHYDKEAGLFLRAKTLAQLPLPLCRPFLISFFIQSSLNFLKLHSIYVNYLRKNTNLKIDKTLKNKFASYKIYRHKLLFEKLEIKKIVRSDNTYELLGCTRTDRRCFGSIINNVPEFLIKNRWLPPCCLQNLEITGRYVFDLLEKFQIRYWLEGGSLLGAARNGQIIEWDYDIDIGINLEDIDRLPFLAKLFQSGEPGQQLEDGRQFVWERALEGKFIRVHYSKQNRIHVDIFPFYSQNGIMTKDFWLDDHPQDKPFPEKFLKPLGRMMFIGINVSVPNNVKEFLEFKFGKSVIENPKYPSDQIKINFI